MPKPHIIETYEDEPHKRVDFCKVCGQDNPTGDCPGEYQMSKKEKSAFEEQFRRIFA